MGGPQSATGAFSIPQQPQCGASSPAPQQGPGEYTRMFSQPSAAPSMAAPPMQASPVPTAKKPSLMPVLIVFGILAVIAIAVVLFFALRK